MSVLLVLAVTVRRVASRLKRSVVLKLRSAVRFQTLGNILAICNIINIYILCTKCVVRDRKHSGIMEWQLLTQRYGVMPYKT
jgi:hypothetical protein